MNDLNQYYDLHVHCGPEAIPRKYDFLEFSRRIAGSGMRGAVIKSHFHATSPWAYLAAKHGAANLFGSLTLNHYVGGINPDAVRASLGLEINGKPCLKVVWMPTIHAQGHCRMQIANGQAYDIPAEWTGGVPSKGRRKLEQIEPINILTDTWRPKSEQVLELIARNQLILATGHLTREEILYLVPQAVQIGVEKIILTHPAYAASCLSIEDLLDLTRYPGVYVEQSYGLILIDDLPISHMVQQIKAIGAGRTILSSDLGQTQTVDPPEGMQIFFGLLEAEGISLDEIEQMALLNPQKLLGTD